MYLSLSLSLSIYIYIYIYIKIAFNVNVTNSLRPEKPTSKIEVIQENISLLQSQNSMIYTNEYVKELKLKSKGRKRNIKTLELKIKTVNEEKELLNEKLMKSELEIRNYKGKVSETQRMMEEALEKYSKDTFANNNKCENEGELGYKIKSLEVTIENMSESLIQNEKDLKNLLGEKKNNLEAKMLDKIRDIEFYDIRLEDYLKNKRMLFKVGIIIYLHN